jgi:antitoxin component of RelBE/YafQ-DinJ toxin-antitoxin module
MPTKDRTAISAKVRTVEKALFGQLCKTEGLTPSKAIRSFILACNERGAIGELEIHDARYMASYGISQMR